MRLFLDAHISARRIAAALRRSGHDVRSVNEERGLDGWTDERLLELATAEGRIMVTFNARDFVLLARTWAEAGKTHQGCVIFVGVRHGEFGRVLQRLGDVLGSRQAQRDWRDIVILVGRSA
ncbi:MAG TPA: DUF5615 family PIN-like protein [Ktedonobacterales bacterium]|nr:DUF5615 family PIN-like protein [Ktedonobacterales bacterium]